MELLFTNSGGGDFVGRDKIVKGEADLEQYFAEIHEAIQKRPADESVDKDDLAYLATRIEKEIRIGQIEAPNMPKIERLLKTLANWAPDIFDITVNVLVNPMAGIPEQISSTAWRLKG